jgi:hypothetical protein
MTRITTRTALALLVSIVLLCFTAGCLLEPGDRKPRTTLFIGVDASGSFKHSGYYDNALRFLAHYIYAHMNGLGGLEKPQALFVGSVGGSIKDEPKTFHPIHDFDGKSIEQIEAELRAWFRPDDTLTDFNSFFEEVSRITKERNLILAPITVMLVSDGIPDFSSQRTNGSKKTIYSKIDLKPLEYLSRNITVRLAYASPTVGKRWRTQVKRQRVRLWTVDADVMKRWPDYIQPGVDVAQQDRFLGWMKDNVDFKVRARRI